MDNEPGYRIQPTSLGECAVVLDMGGVDRNPHLLELWPVFLEAELTALPPPAERPAWWARRVKACKEEAAARAKDPKRDAWAGDKKLKEAMS